MRRGIGSGARKAAAVEDATLLGGSAGLAARRKAPRGDKYADVVVEEDDDESDEATPGGDGIASGSSAFGLGRVSLGPGARRGKPSRLAMRARAAADDEDDEMLAASSSSEVLDEDNEAADQEDLANAMEYEDYEFRPSFRSSRGGLGSSRKAARQDEDDLPASKSSTSRTRGIGASKFVKATKSDDVQDMDVEPQASGPPEVAQSSSSATSAGMSTSGVPGPPPIPPSVAAGQGPGPPPSIPASINPYASSESMRGSGMPSSFGASATSSSGAFKRKARPAAEREMPPAALPKFATQTSRFNPAAMLQAMGWSGGGLGKEGEGMVNPIEVQLRPEKAGLAFGGRKEMTKQTRAEEQRRGHREGSAPATGGEGSSDEEDRRGARRRKARAKKDDGADGAVDERSWTRRERKPRKPRVEHRTYEELIEEAGGIPETEAGGGKVYDASGREHASLAAALAHHAVPTQAESSAYLPELRHNLRLICEANRRNLDVLARQGADILERRRWLRREKEEATRKMASQRTVALALRSVLAVVQELESIGMAAQQSTGIAGATANGSVEDRLNRIDPVVARILNNHREDVQKYGLDEALVGAIAPALKNAFRQWDPLAEPRLLVDHLLRWQDVLQPVRLSLPSISKPRDKANDNVMSAYETLLWQTWMPSVRTALNNRWDPSLDPTLPLPLIEAWQPLLPHFIMENIFNQLLLPKLSRAVSDWTPSWKRRGHMGSGVNDQHRHPVELHQIVFPWLPVLSDRLDDIMAEARRRVKSMLKSWRVSVPMPVQLEQWRKIIDSNEWDSMLLTNIVPKLSAHLRDDFEVNPGDQDVGPLETVLSWRHVLRKSVLSRMLEIEFFGKWLRILHMWLVQPTAELEEVAQWFAFWKAWFPEDVAELPGMIHGFQKGMKLIEEAAALGSRRTELPLPDFNPLSRTAFTAAQDALDRQHGGNRTALRAGQPTGANKDVTFRTLVEEAAGAVDLFVLPLNRSHAATGHALYRLSGSVDGKGAGGSGGKGVVFYIDDDVCFVETAPEVQDGGGGASTTFEPASIEELVELARLAASSSAGPGSQRKTR